MSSFDEKIARAKAAQSTRPAHADVFVSLDSELLDERARLIDEIGTLNQERERIITAGSGVLTLPPDTTAIDTQMNALGDKLKKLDELDRENLIHVRLYRLDGGDWLDMVAGHPPRLNSAIDLGVGYNVNTLTIAALITHGRIVDGENESIRADEDWIALVELLAGGEFMKLVDGVYGLNVADARKRTEALKNSYEAALASDKK